jgi:hypothetical protein
MTIMRPRMGFGIAGLLAVVRKPKKRFIGRMR